MDAGLPVCFASIISTMKSEKDFNDTKCNPSDKILYTDINGGPEPELHFILTLEKHPELWNPANALYTNKFGREKALLDLLPILKKLKPYATLDDVRKKINSLRSNHKRELRKMKTSLMSGEEYNPTVWHFPYLRFLNDLDKQKMYTEDSYLEETKSPPYSDDASEDGKSSTSMTTPKSIPKVKIERSEDPLDEGLYTFAPCTNNRNQPPIIQEWANILERLDPMQRIYAKKAINDILFEAELGNLKKDSVKIN